MGVFPANSGGAPMSEAPASDTPKADVTRAEGETTEKNTMELETMPITEEGVKPFPKVKKPLDTNIYSTKKTVAQGMMDLALLTANASQLKLILKYNQEKSSIFAIHVTCIAVSIMLQIIVGVMLIVNSRYDINRPSHHTRADLMNNLTVIGVFLITVVNVISASFSDST